jgi:hypothetical protein
MYASHRMRHIRWGVVCDSRDRHRHQSHLTFASHIRISYRDYLLTPDALERVTASQSEVFRTRNDCLISTILYAILYALAIVSVSA